MPLISSTLRETGAVGNDRTFTLASAPYEDVLIESEVNIDSICAEEFAATKDEEVRFHVLQLWMSDARQRHG